MDLKFKPLLAVLLPIMFVAPGCLGDENAGVPLDEFSYTADDGNEYSNTNMKGADYLIYFSASWCSRCYKSMHNISDAIGDTDQLIMSIEEEDMNGLSTWHQTVNESNSTQDLISPFMDGSKLSEVLGVSAIPTIFLIDEDGNIIDIHEGDLTDHDEILKFLNQA